MGNLEGKIALITGGNSGIVNEGADAFVTERRAIGRNVTAVQSDVATSPILIGSSRKSSATRASSISFSRMPALRDMHRSARSTHRASITLLNIVVPPDGTKDEEHTDFHSAPFLLRSEYLTPYGIVSTRESSVQISRCAD